MNRVESLKGGIFRHKVTTTLYYLNTNFFAISDIYSVSIYAKIFANMFVYLSPTKIEDFVFNYR
jgi:hypothetical protein